MKKRMTAAIYARVSTVDQNCDMQLTELRAYAERMGWPAVEYVEKVSGKAGSRRPELNRLMADARLRKFDVVLVWKLDRFGRSLRDLVENIQALDSAGVRFLAPSQNIDTDVKSPMGRLILHLLGAFAEFEHALMMERVHGGQTEYARAYAAGEVGKKRASRSGRNLAPHRPSIIFRRDEAVEMRLAGKSWRAIAEALDVDFSTVRRAVSKVLLQLASPTKQTKD